MKLKIADDLSLPIEAVTETFGILAARGAGKSNTAAVMAEEMFRAKLPFVVVDPVRAWWGLRSSRDGTGPGLQIPIFGGRRGDVPLERGGGQLVADLIVDQRLSCVLDLSEFESEGAKKQFLLDFARRLYQRNEAPLHLFLEEADDYIPQRPMGRDEPFLLRAWENIVRRGRSRGLGCTLITQRSASLNKNVLTQVQTLIPMRTTGPQDIAAIKEWVKYHHQGEALLESLPGLEDGEGWVWSPHFLGKMVRVHFRQRETFDSGATPKASASPRPPATLADVDLGALKTKMAATIEKAKAEDPKLLRQQLADLKRQLAARAPVEKTAEKIVEVPVLKDGQLARVEKVADRLEQHGQKFLAEAAELRRLIAPAAAPRPLQRHVAQVPARPQRETTLAPARTSATLQRRGNGSEAPAEGLTGPEQRILDALAWLESVGNAQPEQPAVAFLAGYTIGGGAFNNPKGRLRGNGLIDYLGGDRLALTAEGRKLARAPESDLTADELQSRVLQRLPGPERKLLQVLIESYPNSLPYDELARRSGYAEGGGAFNNPRGRLHSLGLISYPAPGKVVALPVLFLE